MVNKSSPELSALPKPMSAQELSPLCFSHDLDLSKFSRSLWNEESFNAETLQIVSASANQHVAEITASRQGRDLQRYSQEMAPFQSDYKFDDFKARLTTGTVPILKDGRILLVSSTDGSTWVFPKGGWETDETLPEGAIRESFEEAGVLGVLGPPLPTITYETRKARKRRIGEHLASSTPASQPMIRNETPHAETGRSVDVDLPDASATPLECTNGAQSTRTPSLKTATAPVDLTASSGICPKKKSKSHYHSHNCMTFFPLYVQEISDSWPEAHRNRRAFSLEETEHWISRRPEFLAVVEAVKERKLNVLAPEE